jgi:hypothetical protein
MRALFILIAHLLVILAKLARPGGLRAVVAESLAVKTPVAHHEACAAPCSESEIMGSTGAGIVCAFRVIQTLEQDGRDTENFHTAVLSPSPGEAQVFPALLIRPLFIAFNNEMFALFRA